MLQALFTNPLQQPMETQSKNKLITSTLFKTGLEQQSWKDNLKKRLVIFSCLDFWLFTYDWAIIPM